MRVAAGTAALTVSLAIGCASADIQPMFDKARLAAQADPGAAPADFQPDVELVLSPAMVTSLARSGLAQNKALADGWTGDVAGVQVQVRPNLALDALKLAASTACAQCVTVAVDLSGPVELKAGPLSYTAQAQAHGTVDGEVVAVADGDGFALTLALKRVSGLSVTASGLGHGVEGTLQQGLEQSVNAGLKNMAPLALGTVGAGAGKLVRGVRVGAVGAGLEVQMLSSTANTHAVARETTAPARGFRLVVADDALVELAAAQAYDKKPKKKTHDIVPVPTSLAINGNQFDLGLRLWCLSGSGWWRDYIAHGTLALDGKKISLQAKTGDEGAQSKGADLADPLAALGESVIVDDIAEAVTRIVPIRKMTGSKAVTLTSVSGQAGALVVDGDVAD